MTGFISPNNVGASASILLLAGVALGGRASLFGPALGAIAVEYGRSTLSESFPTQWTYFLGALFILVVLLLPGGVASLWPKLKERLPLGSATAAPTSSVVTVDLARDDDAIDDDIDRETEMAVLT